MQKCTGGNKYRACDSQENYRPYKTQRQIGTRLLILDPVIGSNGLISIKGRLGKSGFPDEQNHSVVVKGSHWVVQSYIRKCHEPTVNSGVNDILVPVRRKL